MADGQEVHRTPSGKRLTVTEQTIDVPAEQMVEVRFSVVHWYAVGVPKAKLDEASGGRELTGRLYDMPYEVAEEVDGLLTTAADTQHGSLTETDGLEVHSVKPVS